MQEGIWSHESDSLLQKKKKQAKHVHTSHDPLESN